MKSITGSAEKIGVNDSTLMVERILIRPSGDNPRKVFNDAAMQTLAESIKEQGVLQPLIVRYVGPKYRIEEPNLTHQKTWQAIDIATREVAFQNEKKNLVEIFAGDLARSHYELVSGERRWRAAGMAGLDLVPVVARDLTDRDVFLVRHAENAEREELGALDEGESFHKAVNVDQIMTVEELCRELNRSRSHVYGRMKLALLPDAIKDAVRKGELNPALAELVAKIPGEKNQLKCLKEILEGGRYLYDAVAEEDADYEPQREPMSVREAKLHVRDKYTLDLEDAVFDIKDAALVPAAGACAKCPKRSGNCADLFPDLAKRPNVCTDPDCFERKKQAHIAAARAEAEKKGLRLVPEKKCESLFKYGNELPHYGVIKKLEDVEVPGTKKTAKEILGDDAPEPMLAVAPNGKTHKIFNEGEIKAALEQKGFKLDREERKETPEEKARKEAKAKAQRELIAELRGEIVAAYEKGTDGDLLKLMLVEMMDRHDFVARAACKRAGTRLGGPAEREKEIAKLKPVQVRRILLERLLGEPGRDGLDWEGRWQVEFQYATAFAGIDLKAREKAALAPLKQSAAENGKGTDPTQGADGAAAAANATARKTAIAAAAKARWARVKKGAAK